MLKEMKILIAEYDGVLPHSRFRRVAPVPVAWLDRMLATKVAQKTPQWVTEIQHKAINKSQIDMNLEPLRAIAAELEETENDRKPSSSTRSRD